MLFVWRNNVRFDSWILRLWQESLWNEKLNYDGLEIQLVKMRIAIVSNQVSYLIKGHNFCYEFKKDKDISSTGLSGETDHTGVVQYRNAYIGKV